MSGHSYLNAWLAINIHPVFPPKAAQTDEHVCARASKQQSKKFPRRLLSWRASPRWRDRWNGWRWRSSGQIINNQAAKLIFSRVSDGLIWMCKCQTVAFTWPPHANQTETDWGMCVCVCENCQHTRSMLYHSWLHIVLNYNFINCHINLSR